MNKQGKAAGMILSVVAVLALVSLVGLAFWLAPGLKQQTAVGEGTPAAKQVEQVSTALKEKTASIIKFRARDVETDNAQVATSLSVSYADDGGATKLSADATAMSASDATSVTSEVGRKVKACAFNQTTYYGLCKEFVVSGEAPEVDLDVFATANARSQLKVECFDSSDNNVDNGVGGFRNCSTAIGASQTVSFTRIRIEVNATDVAYNFKGYGFNLTSGSNIEDITSGGAIRTENLVPTLGMASSGTVTKGSEPDRLSSFGYDYVFYVDNAIMLHEWDVLSTPGIQFKAKQTNPDEMANLLIIDEALFKSTVDSTKNQILSGVETNANTEVDVGAIDVPKPFQFT